MERCLTVEDVATRLLCSVTKISGSAGASRFATRRSGLARSAAGGFDPMEIARRAGGNESGDSKAAVQAARRWTSQTVTAASSADNASSQPPSIHWNGQK
jgi:hypothetical protein